MLNYLERQTRLTNNQRRIIFAAILGDLLEFFDYFLIGFVVAFIAGPWKLTFGQSAVVLLASGFGAMFGAVFYGWLADKIGRRPTFILTVLNFSVATGILTFTPERAWLFLAFFRFIIGFGTGGLYCVDLPLVQEFVPSAKRGRVGGLVTASVPLGILLGAVLGATATPYVGWRGLFAIGIVPGLLTLLIRAWVPESPRWLIRMGRMEEARRSLAWALEMDPAELPLTAQDTQKQPESRLRDIFRYPRSLAVSFSTNLFSQIGYYGMLLWAPTLLVQLLTVTPARAAFLMIFVNLGGFAGKVTMAFLSDIIGRKASGGIVGFGAAIFLMAAALWHGVFLGTVSLFWLLLIGADLFVEGGFAIVGPYSAEVWPASLRTTGMGAAYGFGGLGKVLGPVGLALIVGSSNIITPAASVAALLPAYSFLAACFVVSALVFLLFGMETKGHTLETIEHALGVPRTMPMAPAAAEKVQD
jgi:MFS transporter, putative metabolite:H+ symporter